MSTLSVGNFTQSLLWGAKGTYEWRGNSVRFEGHPNLTSAKSDAGRRIFFLFNVSRLSYLRTFIHEMGHALAAKLVKENPGRFEITIRESSAGVCRFPDDLNATWLQENVVSENIHTAAGPLTSVSVASFMFLLGSNLKKYPFLAYFLQFIACSTIFEEYNYFVNSTLEGDGDWGKIFRRNKTHYALATSLFFLIICGGFKEVIKTLVSYISSNKKT